MGRRLYGQRGLRHVRTATAPNRASLGTALSVLGVSVAVEAAVPTRYAERPPFGAALKRVRVDASNKSGPPGAPAQSLFGSPPVKSGTLQIARSPVSAVKNATSSQAS